MRHAASARALARLAAVLVALCLIARPLLEAQAPAPQPATPCGILYNRLLALTRIDLPAWNFHNDTALPNGAEPGVSTEGWRLVQLGEIWPGGAGWFRSTVTIPASLHGYDLANARVRARFRVDNEGGYNLWVDGVPIGGVEQQANVLVEEHAKPGPHVFAVHVNGSPGQPKLHEARLDFDPAPGRPQPRDVGEACRAAELLLDTDPEHRGEHEATLARAVAGVDWPALDRGDQRAFDESLRAARAVLGGLDPWLKTLAVSATANSHIDLAWLWTWTETVEVVRNTFRDVLAYMRQFPGMVFAHSSVQTYAWMEEKYPQIFDQVRQFVREGRWEVVGGMWVEPDLNMPDGESIVRQLLQGIRYDKEKFGVDVRVGWNPDSFGYSWQLPQIYRKCGIDFFVTQKMAWNDTTRFPHEVFWWQSPDGSRVLTYFPHDYTNFNEPIKLAADLADYARSSGRHDLLHLYGIGDHGGGPMRAMLESAVRLREPSTVFPRFAFSRVDDFFAGVQKSGTGSLPTWDDELYLEYHRGVYTSQAETKRHNRRSEELLLNAEKLETLAPPSGSVYPQADLTAAWRAVLFNQFHDLLSGTSINAVYRDADRSYAEVERVGERLVDTSLRRLAAAIRTAGPGVPVVVFNPLSWNRSEVVDVQVGLPEPARSVAVTDADGRPMLAQIVARGAEPRIVTVRFLAEDVPSLGYRVFHVVAPERAGAPAGRAVTGAKPPQRSRQASMAATAAGTTLENEFLRVRVDATTGCITSVFDKGNRREALAAGACGNTLQAFVDKPKEWDAWNIDADYESHETDLTRADDVSVVDPGPLRAAIRVRRHFQSSTFTQDITLAASSPRVDIVTDIDWHEHHVLLKAAFPVSVAAPAATYEIPFGSIPRPTTRNTPAERAKFEVPALRWADLSEAAYGVSLLNDSKYGYDTHGSVMRLSLLRGPTWPDPEADQGRHHFVYSLYPHARTWKDAETERRGYELNYPLIALVATAHGGELPPARALLTVDARDVVVTALKKPEDGRDAMIVRFYEWAGRQTAVRIRVASGVSQASETDLLERPVHPLQIDQGAVVVPTGPYEIKTIEIRVPQVLADRTRPQIR